MMINNKDTLLKIKADYKEKQAGFDYTVLICSGAGCISSNCEAVKTAFDEALASIKPDKKVDIKLTGCMGTCNIGPAMIIQPGNVFYCKLEPEDMAVIVQKHLVEGGIAEEYCITDEKTGKPIPCVEDIPFFINQQKIVLKNCGNIDCLSMEEYIACDGYQALFKALEEMSPESVIDTVSDSGLRGRGGGGFPTGLKWKLARKSQSDKKFVICNADEGDPGAFMDRSVLEGDPHTVIEGMAIAGYAIGSDQGYVYVRAEYPLAVERLQTAIDDARESGVLGKGIFGKDFDFDIEIRIGAGAFVCGEETALISSVEGARGEPKQKPPYPSDEGLFKKPTIINNVETFANISSIINQGADWFKQSGTEKSKGTKVFALAGDITNTGIVEVPMGITLGEVIFDVGGGIPKDKKFKVAQTGGPSGGCLTKEHLNVPLDYDSLVELGAIMGSGGLICMDEDTCMVDVARFFMEFVQDESCGKCVACRLGTKRMLEILERITKGQGVPGDIEKLERLGKVIKDTALCGLGQTAPNPVLSTIKYFREEYEEHINEKYCRAGVCADMFISPCENACPAGVNVPGYIALIAAGRIQDAYNLIRMENPFPSVCGRVCTHPCESRCRRAQLDDPVAIMDLKRYAADEAMKMPGGQEQLILPRTGKSVGIVGAGPSGLTCGYYLARLGYDVTVYESEDVPGGMLSYAIPEYRLPKAILQKEIDILKESGVTIKTGVEIGKDITFDDIKEKHDAVYIATGTQISKKVGIDGEEKPGVFHGLDFLREANLGRLTEVKGKVAVIGGGNTAIDASRVALRLGADEVHIIYRRSEEDMPAEKREIADAIEEGITVHTLLSPIAFIGDDHVTHVKCKKMTLSGFDNSGRKVPKETEEIIEFPVDMVIPAVSQYSDLPFVEKNEVELTRWGTFVVDKQNRMTSIDGVFAGGDVVRGPDAVITAIADGKASAASIDLYLGGKGELNKGRAIEIPMNFDEGELVEHERFGMKWMDPDKRKDSFDEVSLGFHKLNATAEAMRCLRCDRREG
ncbi:MAG: FAD-dependent oxidoreductase [Eubacteriales bacterium]